MQFKDRLKQLRYENKYTQQELAEKLFVSKSVISKWENGVRYPSYEELNMLKDIFSISIDSLFEYEEIEKMPEINPIVEGKKNSIIELALLVTMAALYVVKLLFDFTLAKDIVGIYEEVLTDIILEIVTIPMAIYFVMMSYKNEISPKNAAYIVELHFLCALISSIITMIRGWKSFLPNSHLMYVVMFIVIPVYMMYVVWNYFVANKEKFIKI